MLLLTAAEMRAWDRATIDRGGATGEMLMERAGEGVADVLEQRFGSVLASRVLVLCGPGHNGGDGFVAARHLAARGARVRVVLAAAGERVRGDALAHLRKLEAAGTHVETMPDEAKLEALGTSGEWDHALDALLGTGAEGEPRGVIAAACTLLRRLRTQGTRVTAVDVPTGVGSDDGGASEHAVWADLTVTFAAAKRGHFLYPGRSHRGELRVVDIGLLPAADAGVRGVTLAEPSELRAHWPERDPRAHKGDAGRVVLAGGAAGMTGALVLAARAAARAGAGYVRVCAPASVADVLASQLVEPMVVGCGEGTRRSLTTTALAQVREECSRADAVALGPGLSRDPHALALVRSLLPALACPVVVDADALAALSPAREHMAGSLGAGVGERVLTPHVLELERLTGVPRAELESQRIDAAAQWASRWNAVVVLKGAPTVIAHADGRVCVNPTGNPGMATAGMGDVLTGAIAALLAQGLSAYDAACLGVYVHGWAGDLAARESGPVGLIASDVVERLPRALDAVRTA